MGAKIFVDFNNYPQAKSMVSGQRISIQLSGRVVGTTNSGIMYEIDSLGLGKKSKLNPTEVMIANKLDRIEQKLPGVATRP